MHSITLSVRCIVNTISALLLCISLSFSASTMAQTVISQQTIATDLANPWSIALLPNNEFLVTERPGHIARVSATGTVTRLSGLPNVVAERQGGVLGVVLDPDFTTNRTLYVCLVGADGAGNTGSEVYKATLATSSLTNVTQIFAARPKIKSGFHFGCRLAFANDGALFITLGDRYSKMDQTQSLDNHYGKVVRVLSDGSPHPQNPFLDSAVPEVYSIGHRNVQGIALHPKLNVMWAHEHGPKGGDELNTLKAGANYGWPTITYGINYNGDIISDKTAAPGLEQPLTYWVPSIAPSGMAFYKDDLLVGSLKFRHLRYLTLQDNQVVRQTELLTDLDARIRDVAVAADNTVYVVTDEPKGRLIALQLQP
jgi:glucose/arabinose dehydrogenase